MSNKYQEALNNICCGCYGGDDNCNGKDKFCLKYLTLQELVDKEKPRTEQEILKDFESLGWRIIIINNKEEITLKYGYVGKLFISRCFEYYQCECSINIQEHKLLNELFTLWGWL